VYLERDFFCTAFMSFLFCSLTLTLVGWALPRAEGGGAPAAETALPNTGSVP
jgi:hypothetical protein